MANSIFIWPGSFSTSGGTITLLQSTLSWPLGTSLVEEAANTLADRNGTNPQIFNIYNTFTDATHNEGFSIKWLSNQLLLGNFKGSAGGSNRTIGIRADITANGWLVDTSNNLATEASNFQITSATGAITKIGNIATTGSFGASPITAVSAATGLTAADTNRINYTPAAAASDYSINGCVNVTAWTTPASFTVALTYKDASGNSRTDTAAVTRGSTGAAAAAITAVDRWYYDFPLIDIDASGTAITISTTGTFTGSPVYNHAVCLNRLR